MAFSWTSCFYILCRSAGLNRPRSCKCSLTVHFIVLSTSNTFRKSFSVFYILSLKNVPRLFQTRRGLSLNFTTSREPGWANLLETICVSKRAEANGEETTAESVHSDDDQAFTAHQFDASTHQMRQHALPCVFFGFALWDFIFPMLTRK